MRDDLQQMRDKSIELEIKLDRVSPWFLLLLANLHRTWRGVEWSICVDRGDVVLA